MDDNQQKHIDHELTRAVDKLADAFHLIKDVFSEKPAFRIVPLIHYASILFYICKLSEWKNIELPRTVSFSGKGSEYINLLFPASAGNNNTDLKGFTQTMLELFSGKGTHKDFIIEKSTEPKVITARGAVYYAVEDIKEDVSNDWGITSASDQRANEKKLVKENVKEKAEKKQRLFHLSGF